MQQHEVAILGAGPAGLAAGLYAARSKLDTLVIEHMMAGGQIVNSLQVENYPGHEQISGQELAGIMEKQALSFGARITPGSVQAIQPEDKLIRVVTDIEEIQARVVIVATGARPQKLDVPGEEELTGRGVSYCATCDAPFYQGLTVVVVGGGNAAVEEAMVLSRFADRVILVHRRDRLRATVILQERLFANPRVEIMWDTTLEEISGQNEVIGVVALNKRSGAREEVPCSGVFIYAGYLPNTQFAPEQLELDEKGYVITGPGLSTSIKGVYAAGDVRKKRLRQVVTAAADGAEAAISAEHYLENLG